VQAVIDELGGEKIDIIEWNEDRHKFIKAALSPAKVTKVDLDEEAKTAIVHVPEDQLSLAIGRKGQNVRLASKLTGLRIDIAGSGTKKGAEGGMIESESGDASTSDDDSVSELSVDVSEGVAEPVVEQESEEKE
jgi:N utilization substance protein A